MALVVTILVALLPSALAAQTTEPVVVTLANLQRVYSGADATFDSATDVSVTPGTVEDYNVTLSFPGRRTPPRNVGSYTVRVVATSKTDSALTATANFTLAIAKAPLTVTANDQARLLGVANPRFTLSYDGFVADETETVLNRRPAGTTTARTSSPAGEYEITVIGGSDNNYDIVTRNPGTLTIVPAFPGTYESFLFDTGDANLPVGKLTLTLPARGARFTGRLDLASEGATLPLAGTLAPNENLSGAEAFAERRATTTSVTYRVEFSITPEGLSAALYQRELGETENVFHLRVESPVRLVTFTKAEPAPTAGAYTLALLNSLSPFGIDYPGGTSHATGTIAFNGVFKLSGRFADGAKFTASAGADANQGYRLFLRPYGSRLDSFAAGDFTLQAHSSPDREGYFFVPQSIAESFFWTKAAKPSGTPDKLFPQGFGPLDSILVIDPWLRPAKAAAGSLAITLAQRLGLSADPTNSALAILIHGSPGDDLGNSQFELPEFVEFTATNKALPVLAAPLPGQKPVNPRAWKLSVNAATGAFTGSFRLDDEVSVPTEANPGATRNHRRNITVQGVLRQSPEDDTVIGAGYFLLVPRLDMMEFFPDTLSSDFRLQRPDAD